MNAQQIWEKKKRRSGDHKSFKHIKVEIIIFSTVKHSVFYN